MVDEQQARHSLSMTQVLLCGAAVVTMSMGIRHAFGLWLQPITIVSYLDPHLAVELANRVWACF